MINVANWLKSQRKSTEVNGSQRKSTEVNGSQRKSTEVNGSQRKSTEVNGSQRKSKPTNFKGEHYKTSHVTMVKRWGSRQHNGIFPLFLHILFEDDKQRYINAIIAATFIYPEEISVVLDGDEVCARISSASFFLFFFFCCSSSCFANKLNRSVVEVA